MMISNPRVVNCKYLKPDWAASNKLRNASAEIELSKAERLCNELDAVIKDTSATTIKFQRDVDKKLEQRLKDVEHWREEVNDRIGEVNLEIDALEACDVRLEKELEGLRDPLHIVHHCLTVREGRKGIELVDDDVEKELMMEMQVYSGVQSLLMRTQEQLTEQTRLARKVRYRLEKDINDKDVAMEIDKQNIELKNHAPLIEVKSNGFGGDKRFVTENSWNIFSSYNIHEADKILSNCLNLRIIVDNVLQQVLEDMEYQKEATDVALKKRIAEIKDAKHKLEEQLALINSQVLTTEENLEKISLAITDKETPKKLAEARIENRSYRPNLELCMDKVQLRLFDGSQFIDKSIEKLEEYAKKVKVCLKGLRHQQLELEEDVSRKNDSLLIDEADCQSIRRSMIIRKF